MKQTYQQPTVTKWQYDEEDVLTASLEGTINDQGFWTSFVE
jgi:hypothetical protein